VSKRRKFIEQLMSGAADADLSFDDLCQLLRRLGFKERIRGDHHIFAREGVEEILNIQPKEKHAKPYQVKQVRNVIRKYQLEEVK
jgi:predicted RNA binding protein YcfA (HicA-like mRNA interferase family)